MFFQVCGQIPDSWLQPIAAEAGKKSAIPPDDIIGRIVRRAEFQILVIREDRIPIETRHLGGTGRGQHHIGALRRQFHGLRKKKNGAIVIVPFRFNSPQFIERIHIARTSLERRFERMLSAVVMPGSRSRDSQVVKDFKIARNPREHFAEC